MKYGVMHSKELVSAPAMVTVLLPKFTNLQIDCSVSYFIIIITYVKKNSNIHQQLFFPTSQCIGGRENS